MTIIGKNFQEVMKMRILTAILMLATAIPSYAQLATVRVVDLNRAGNGELVKEYEGRQRGGLEADFSYSSLNGSNYIGIEANGLNGSSENGYIDLNLGSELSIKGKFSQLTHRTPNLRTFTTINGQYVTPQRSYAATTGGVVKISTETTQKLTDLTGGPVSFDRVESEAKVVYSPTNYPNQQITLGVWQEQENGRQLARYPNGAAQVMSDNLDRNTRDLSLGINTPLGSADMSLEFTQRVFEDDSSTVPAKTSKLIRPEASKQLVNLYDIRFRSDSNSLVPFTGALSGRSRTNKHNGYTANAYAATLAASYKPLKKVYVSAKAYGRVTGLYENKAYRDDLGVLAGEEQIGYSNLAGDLKARYEFSDKLNFRGGYKYENNYRRHARDYEEQFTKEATYQDGTVISSNSQTNAVAVQDTKQTVMVGFDLLLPLDVELSADYRRMVANHATFESMPTVQDKIEASLNVPLPMHLTLMTSGSYLSEKNKKSNLTDTSMHQNSYQAAIEWAGNSKVSAGADYGYDQSSHYGTGWFGASNSTTSLNANGTNFHEYPQGGSTNFLTNLIRVPGMLYRYENNVIGIHATVVMPKGFSLTGRGTYTMSRGSIPVYINGPWRDFSAVPVVTNLGPSDTRITSGSLVLKYVKSQDLTARLGYRRDQWVDKVDAVNSGWVNTVTASVSAKF